ncbi:MAG TPA: BrnT family toxin [Acidobacteriaceae bacterium]|nr:BrnT family toxin [Acidobacteriaceae bacterium]
MSSLRFEWDEAKNLLNQRKHGIGFDEASRVFDDPLYITAPERVEDGRHLVS